MLSDDPDTIVEHRLEACTRCGGSLHAALPAQVVSFSEQIELPEVAPIVKQHRRLAVRCPSCGERGVAPLPEAARGTHSVRGWCGGDVPEDLSGALV